MQRSERSARETPARIRALHLSPPRSSRSVDQLPLHRVDGQAPHPQPVGEEHYEVPEGGPALEPEHGVTYELHEVVERIEVRERLRPVRELVQREERAGEQEERREHGADDVVEVLKRLREAGDRNAEARPAEAGDPGD